MVEPVCHESFITLASGASTTRKTDGASPKIPAGLVVRWVCVELGNGSGPVHVVVHIVVAGKPVEIRAKWVRGPSDHGGAGALIWDGYFPIPKSTEFFVAVRNDSGSTADLALHWVTERLA